jgi:hypothetical protein
MKTIQQAQTQNLSPNLHSITKNKNQLEQERLTSLGQLFFFCLKEQNPKNFSLPAGKVHGGGNNIRNKETDIMYSFIRPVQGVVT